MKWFVPVVFLLLIPASACAQYSANSDVIGIYFDAGATEVAVIADESTILEAYLMITNPTAATIGGWECSLDYDNEACAILGGWDYTGNALNICTAPEFAVGLSEPIPATAVTTLLTMTFFVLDIAGTTLLVGPAPDPSTADNLPLYLDGADLENLILLENSTGYGVGSEILPCASINVWVDRQTWSWGGLKAMYQ